jgi:hypothetical protein
MSLEDQMFTSFVKGVAKTTGVLTVLSVIGGIWYIKTNVFNDSKLCSENEVIINEISKDTSNDENIKNKDNIEQDLKDDITMSFIDVKVDGNSKYKKVLDKICYK